MELFVPGRVCLFGEHSDWAGGYREQNPEILPGRAIIVGTEQGIHARVERHPDALVLHSVLPRIETEPSTSPPASRILPIRGDALRREAEGGGFWSYVAGVVDQVRRQHPIGGLVIENHAMDLPMRKGLSSSAAISVLTARACNRLYHLGLSIRDEMELAYRGEISTGSLCGRMDQACAFGRRPVLLTFDGDRWTAEALPVGGEFHLLLIDLKAGKDTRRILADLNRAYPFPRDEAARGLHELLGPGNTDLIRRASAVLANGDAEGLGRLMTEAQAQFDRWAAPLSPEELAAPALHRLLQHEALRPHLWGGKGVGSQGDGTAQLVARSQADRNAARRIIENELELAALELTLAPSVAD